MSDAEFEVFSTEDLRVPKPPPPPPPESGPDEVAAALAKALRDNLLAVDAAIRSSVELVELGLFDEPQFEKLMHALRRAIFYRNTKVKALAAGKPLATTADVAAASIPEIFIALLALDVGRMPGGPDDDVDVDGVVFFAALDRARGDIEKRLGLERYY